MKKMVIVDLDGTLLTINSMRLFMRWLPKTLLSHRDFNAAFSALWFIGLRGCHLCSHRYMKWHLTKIAVHSLGSSDWDKFATLLKDYVNPKVAKYLIETEATVCMATAAIEEYATPLGALLGVDMVLATPFTPHYDDYEELRGKTKLDAILSHMDSEPITFLTDHYDDLPVAEHFKNCTILVTPSAESTKRFAAAGITSVL